MARPAILTIDDDPEVLLSIERDLRQRYSEKYRILRADSGRNALDLLKKLLQRGDPVALLLVDHRMPQMNGIETLIEAMKLYPDAKRVLLTAYADTDAAIKAINDVQLNHYLLKPWHPPERNLFPVVDDLLDDWYANFHPPFEGIRVLGTRWSPRSYELRDFLARTQVPFEWLDAEAADRIPEVKRLLSTFDGRTPKLPTVIFPTGDRLEQPALSEVVERLGLRTRAGMDFYDVAIVGGGPAGLAASVYGASEGLKTIMIEREAPGGQAGLSSRIENYLGFPSGLSGAIFARRAVDQARRFGVEIVSPQEATSIRSDGPYRYVRLSDGNELSCHAMILAMGVQWRKLGIPGEDRLQGAGVYYGAGSTEAISCRDEDVYLVGGANSAGQAAMFFSNFARRVIMLVRGPSLAATMSQYLIDQIGQMPNISIETRSRVIEVHGDSHLEGITVVCDASGEARQVPASALFIFIGAQPHTAWLDGAVERDERGFIITGQDLIRDGKRPRGWSSDRDPGLLETSVPGVFAVGDVRHGSIKRVASGVGEGSVAIQFVHQYLSKI
ncbi:MAG: response regulator receiver modulated FAD-dependent pyridine nucleotide-disulfide oxidoreductase [Bryobacterales bacterium]|jgi:thioredoxin reductase (NADPH)|nr:response regulator receiver modulated FAD-dependent pyridine nucleotide-disulfide oxidoreductase [Bryobacterales bacterium]